MYKYSKDKSVADNWAETIGFSLIKSVDVSIGGINVSSKYSCDKCHNVFDNLHTKQLCKNCFENK
jgi:hypothetical protein